jgi:hypothetical protein
MQVLTGFSICFLPPIMGSLFVIFLPLHEQVLFPLVPLFVSGATASFGQSEQHSNQKRPPQSVPSSKSQIHFFTIPGLGKLVLVDRKVRVGRNPATSETIQIKAEKVVKFCVAKAAKDAILGTK